MELLRNAGPSGYLVVLIGLGGLAMLAVTAAMVASGRTRQALVFAGLVMAFASSALLVGGVGRTLGRISTFRAVSVVAPEDRERLIAGGFEESNANLILGAGFGLPLLLLAAAAVGFEFARRQEPRS